MTERPVDHTVPTAAELVEAVRAYLTDEVLPATEGRVSFFARVSANVLGMVERELEQGASIAAANQARLAALGLPDDAALAAAIRAGQLDDRYDEVAAAVRASVRDKLLIANPRYLTS